MYRLYQIFIGFPLVVLASILTALIVTIGCTLGSGHFWGYWPGKVWGRVVLWIMLLPVRVEGRELLRKGQSYVFVANHQGTADIFLVYGYLGSNFKWMMKAALRHMPFIGAACAAAHHIFVDRRSVGKVRHTVDEARRTLQGGMSLMVFPEGARTFTGHMGVFRRGAFFLADELQLPVVPITINGSFDVMPRTHDYRRAWRHPLSLTFHAPIMPEGQGPENIAHLSQKSYEAIMQDLDDRYKGFEENPDQR